MAALVVAVAVCLMLAGVSATSPVDRVDGTCSFCTSGHFGAGAYVYDLSSLSGKTFNTTGVDNVEYTLTGPCGAVSPLPAACASEPSSPAYQVLGPSLCLQLGQLVDNSTSALGTSPDQGIRVTLKGGNNQHSCTQGRQVVYNIVCDPTDAGLKSFVESHPCTYEATWGAKAACNPTYDASATCGTHTVPVPTTDQLAYQRHEIMALTHFNMATFVGDGDPACNKGNWDVSQHPNHFNPVKLNISNWIESYNALGAKHAVLTAKHGCGFLLWETNTTLPDGSEYGFGVKRKSVPSFGRDVLEEFSTLMQAAGLGHGFYYSTGNNFYLNTVDFKPAGPLLPGQGKVTPDQYNALVEQHVTELWTKFGSLFEIWFDHGYGGDQKPFLVNLLQKYQPHAVGFGGNGLMPSPVKWVGTESGMPASPVWATGCGASRGDPDASDYCPTGGDTTLQEGDHWFWVGNAIRTLADLIKVYHATVGNNCVLELDFAIDRTGNVDPKHAVAYKALGDWIRSCYGTPAGSATGTTSATIAFSSAQTVDRVMLQEQAQLGERVRAYDVLSRDASGSWSKVASGTAIGYKRIVQFAPISTTGLMLNVTGAVLPPTIANFAAFKPCPSS